MNHLCAHLDSNSTFVSLDSAKLARKEDQIEQLREEREEKRRRQGKKQKLNQNRDNFQNFLQADCS